MSATIKIEMSMSVVKALADLGMAGMKEHRDAYTLCILRWRGNMDRIHSVIDHVKTEFPYYQDSEELFSYLRMAIGDITALLDPSQQKYIWYAMEEIHLKNITEMRRKLEYIMRDNFDTSYYIEYIRDCNIHLLSMLDEFNKVHI